MVVHFLIDYITLLLHQFSYHHFENSIEILYQIIYAFTVNRQTHQTDPDSTDAQPSNSKNSDITDHEPRPAVK